LSDGQFPTLSIQVGSKWCLVERGLIRFLVNTTFIKERKMQKLKNKKIAILIAPLLILIKK